MPTFLALLALAFSPAAEAASSSYCQASAARHIERPVNPHAPGSDSFQFTYSVGEGGDEALPLLVVLPGGPGQGAISMPLAIPGELKVLRIDPRGVGCNEGVPTAALRSDFAATDVLAAIRAEKPKSYILYGASYGTLLATHVAALAEAEGLPPRAIVLEGVLGRAFGEGEYMNGFFKRWAAVRAALPAPVREELARAPLPFGKSAAEWGGYLSSLFFVGKQAGSEEDDAVTQLKRLADPATRSLVEKRLNLFAKAPAADRLRVFREVTCREIANDMRDLQFDYDLVGGELLPRETNFCQGIAFERPFDSAASSLRSPIYYFSGAGDPATPPVQARYHFAHQTRAARIMVTLPAGGHLPLSLNMADCSREIWLAIAAGRELSAGSFSSCLANPKPVVESAGADYTPAGAGAGPL
jgi:pimeloyl-ACP methyl ester carboxylesterase